MLLHAYFNLDANAIRLWERRIEVQSIKRVTIYLILSLQIGIICSLNYPAGKIISDWICIA